MYKNIDFLGFTEEQMHALRATIASTMGHGVLSTANEVLTKELFARVKKQAQIGKIENLFAYAITAAKNLKEERHNGHI